MQANRRYLKLAALILAAALCLCACSNSSQLSPEDANVVLPDPASAENRRILGDDSSSGEYEVTLSIASSDSISLNTVTRTIQVSQDEKPEEKIMAALLEDSADGATVETRLLGCDSGSGVVTVNLSLEAGVNRSDQDYLLLCTSIANTLLGVNGIEAVNVLSGNRSNYLCGLPMGAFVRSQENVAAAYAQVHSESERFPGLNENEISRNVILYFPAQGGRYLLSEVRELAFSSEDYASAVISALLEGPLMRTSAFSAIPGNIDLLERLPEMRLTDAGERIIELEFSSMLTNYLAFASVEPWQLYGSLVLTLCSFVPETDAVRILIDGIEVTECDMYGQRMVFDDGLMRRSDFAPAIGSSCMLYFANEADMLTALEFPVSQAGSDSAAALLSALISADVSQRDGVRSVFPDEITPEDILGVSVKDRVATVNLSSRFYSRSQGLSARQERLMIYAMVNTLASLDQVGAVTFLVEGGQVDSLAQNIYLKTALMPDWGLVQPAAASTSADTQKP